MLPVYLSKSNAMGIDDIKQNIIINNSQIMKKNITYFRVEGKSTLNFLKLLWFICIKRFIWNTISQFIKRFLEIEILMIYGKEFNGKLNLILSFSFIYYISIVTKITHHIFIYYPDTFRSLKMFNFLFTTVDLSLY